MTASAREAKLSPTSYVVLGLISLRGPSTPYDLEVAVAKSVAYFWSFPHSQLYRESDRLASLGLLSVQREENGRRRKLYALTDAGHLALDEWLVKHTDDVFEMRDQAVLQLFFSDDLAEGDLIDLARRQITLYDKRLAEYAAIASVEIPRHGQDRRMAPLRLGTRLAETLRDFWAEIAADPPPAADGGRAPRTSPE
jgi:DNA-binding PadR family transcriptional regulator